MEDIFEFGEYVVYEPGQGSTELGRVAKDLGTDTVFVCFHEGCTAAATPRQMLRHATDAEIATSDANFGFHRFDDECPEYDPDACFMCNHDKRDEYFF